MHKPLTNGRRRLGTILVAVLLLLAGTASVRAQDAQTRMRLMHDLGGPFIIYRDWIQAELKLTELQKQKLLEEQNDYVQETIRLEAKLKGKQDDEREEAMRSDRAKSSGKFWPVLTVILKDDQLKRFRELELQHEGPAGVFRPEIAKALKITDEQRQQFVRVIEDLQETIKPLLKAARSGGNPDAIRPNVIKIIQDHEATIETLMNPTQLKQWQAMRGKPFNTL